MQDSGDDVYFEEEASTPEESLKKLRERLKKCAEEKQEYLEGWQRAKADFINFKKETLTREKELLGMGKRLVFLELIALSDHFEFAMVGEKWLALDASFKRGVEGIYRELIRILERHGIRQFRPLGEILDPARHEPLGEVEGEEGVVREVLQSGYEEDGKIIRPAKVKVGHGHK